MTSESITLAWREADELRKKWKAGMRPGPTIFGLAQRHGVIVFRMVLDPSLSGAFVRSARHKRSVIVVNTNRKNVHHQRFTAAHELGHLRLHAQKGGLVEGIEYSADDPEEHEANVFAAQFLVPLKELDRALKSLRTTPADASDADVIALAREFGVSHHVILWRLKILGNMPRESVQQRLMQADWNKLWHVYAPDGCADTIPHPPEAAWRPDGVSEQTAAIVSRLPETYRNMAFEAYRRGKVTAGRLADFLGIADRQALFDEIVPLLKPDAGGIQAFPGVPKRKTGKDGH